MALEAVQEEPADRATAAPETIDFFISRSGKDAAMGRRVHQVLTTAGCSCVLQDKDFGYKNFLGAMDRGLISAHRIIALFSPDYFLSRNCLAEAYAAIKGDVLNERERLIPLRIVECDPAGLFSAIAYLDLVPLREADDETLAAVLLASVKPGAVQSQAVVGPLTHLWRAPRGLLHKDIGPQPDFTGRETELAALRDSLATGMTAVTQAAQATAVSGLGGIGKSVLAKQYGWLARAAYAGVWWIGAETQDTLLNGLIDLGSHYIPALKSITERDVAAKLTLKHVETSFAKPWLLIYDNVPRPEAIEGWTPRTGAHVLITSRWSEWHGKARPLTLGLFSRKEAVAFLLERTKRHDTAGAERLADALGDLPLALEQAAAYCWGANVSFDDYLAERTALLKKRPRAAGAAPESVWTTFTLALERVIAGDPRTNTASCPEAEKLLGLLSFLAPHDIPLDLIGKDVMSPIERGEAVAALAEVSLITRITFNDDTFGVSVHRLVQDVMRGRLEQAGELATTAARATELLGQAYPSSNDGSLDAMAIRDRLVPQIIAALEHAPEAGAEARSTGYLRTGLVDWRAEHGDGKAALEHYRRALAIAEKLAAGHPERPDWQRDVSLSLERIANVLKDGGDGKAALEHYRRALAIAEKLAAGHPERPDWQRDVSLSLERIGDVLKDGGDGKAALEHYRRALAIREKLAADHPERPDWQRDVAIGNERLGDIHRGEGKVPEARKAFETALRIYDDLVRRNPDDVSSLVNSVVPHWRMSTLDPVQARRHLEQALSILKPLAASGRLVARRGWIARIEAQLAALSGTASPAPKPSGGAGTSSAEPVINAENPSKRS